MSEFSDIDEVVSRAETAGVSHIINVGFDLESSKQSVELSKKYPQMYACVGIHPHHAQMLDDKAFAELECLAAQDKVVAIGETGLDYFVSETPKEIQKESLIRHVRLALSLGKPVVFHTRQAGGEILETLNSSFSVSELGKLRGVFHCFSENIELAKQILDRGFFLSFTGIVTFKNAHAVREVVAAVPIGKIMIETDCPYLAPQAFRGKRNEPSYLPLIAGMIAHIKDTDIETVALATTANAKQFFGVK